MPLLGKKKNLELYPERGPYGVVLRSHHNLKGNSTVFRALHIRQMMEEDVLKFLITGTLAPILTFRWNSRSTKGKVRHIPHKS